MTENHHSVDRRTALKALSVTGAIGLAGCTGNLTGSQSTETPLPSDNTETQEFEDIHGSKFPSSTRITMERKYRSISE